ncbi:aldehyde dehydrogenase family protein [Actinomadura darangshiensis]|uniref:Aldehyde dehydrogenase family protein n=1 Tax=Actinomadura darangshiensis TaxID=705336 RepID=A0A4R5AHA5_9ACTN|nr:aldehyde dehydrogenase family protein [Actinomadura darangshiensis]TDD70314.1 aldehyde dehydrogenase family protein [Actinomadura darangshiensis]
MDHDTSAISAHPWRLLIGGDLVPAARGGRYTTHDPSTERPLAHVPDGDAEDVDRAYRAAAAAAPGWRATAPRARARTVRELARVLRANAEELARLDVHDLGSPYPMMLLDVERAADSLDLFADWALQLTGEVIPASAEHLHYTLREPYGVVARILPFNHPVMFAAGKIAAPLMAGNTVLVKPAHQTPLSALRTGELFADVLPPGVLNVVSGAGPATGAAISAHPGIRRIAFIGSESVGRAIQADAARAAVKHVTMELGGKNAMVVFPDADLEAAADGAVRGMNFTASTGQSCGSTSRLLVHRDIAADLTDRLRARMTALRVGHPLDPDTDVGPLVSADQYRKVLDHLDRARRDGATTLCGGTRPPGLDAGHFIAPTLLTGVRPDMDAANQEIFGPVLSVLPFGTEDEAIRLANSVDYGLTASVWTNDLTCAHRLAVALEAGFVWVNGASQHFPGVPYGGVKASGLGREESLDELLGFTQTKAVTVFNAAPC